MAYGTPVLHFFGILARKVSKKVYTILTSKQMCRNNKPMGKMNLLKSNYTGSVGATTGAVQRGQSVIKARVWSKAPASPTQKKSVRAFEALNRVCGIMAKRWAKWLPVKKENMLLHNALAKYFRAVVKNHAFDVAGFKERTNGTSSILVSGFDFNLESGSLKFKATATLNHWEQGLESWLIVVTDASGHILHCAEPRALEYEFDAVVTPVDPEIIYVLCFASSIQSGKPVLTGFTAGASVFGGVWFPLLQDGIQSAWFENGVLYIVSPSAVYDNGRIIIANG